MLGARTTHTDLALLGLALPIGAGRRPVAKNAPQPASEPHDRQLRRVQHAVSGRRNVRETRANHAAPSLSRCWPFAAIARDRRTQNVLVDTPRTAKPTHVSAYLSHHRRELLALLDGGSTGGVVFARRHAKLMDGLVGSLFDAALAATPQPTRVVRGAVGGDGRGFLGWKSYLDFRFVTDGPPESGQPLA